MWPPLLTSQTEVVNYHQRDKSVDWIELVLSSQGQRGHLGGWLVTTILWYIVYRYILDREQRIPNKFVMMHDAKKET